MAKVTKRFMVVCGTICVCAIILCIAMVYHRKTMVNPVQMGYESVEIERGDTLTSIAREYYPGVSSVMDMDEFMEEIVRINHLKDGGDTITADCYIIVPQVLE